VLKILQLIGAPGGGGPSHGTTGTMDNPALAVVVVANHSTNGHRQLKSFCRRTCYFVRT